MWMYMNFDVKALILVWFSLFVSDSHIFACVVSISPFCMSHDIT